jgi:hypothetical protein
MDGLIAIGVTLILVMPLHMAVLRLIKRLDSPAYLREVGVVVLNPAALDACADTIGLYAGSAIYSAVTFKGTVYRFDRIVPPSYRHHIDRDELFIGPGLIYAALD